MPFADRFTRIDELTRPDHVWLTEDDACLFLGEYTAREGYAYSVTNNLIHNFKKSPDRRGRPEWRHKERAIERAAAAFRRALGDDPPPLTLVPVPPSKARGDPLYDDRMTRMLQAIWPDQQADIRELIVQTESTTAAHAVVVGRPGPGPLRDRRSPDYARTDFHRDRRRRADNRGALSRGARRPGRTVFDSGRQRGTLSCAPGAGRDLTHVLPEELGHAAGRAAAEQIVGLLFHGELRRSEGGGPALGRRRARRR